MNDQFLKLYEEELSHIREMSADFGEQYPQIAGRLGIARDGCEDPFVERMIESFAYLAARVRTKLDSEYSNFAESLLESVYPQLLAPLPSMTIVEFKPDDKLAAPFVIPRNTPMMSHLSNDDDTRCEFRTSQEVVLYPLRISQRNGARYHLRDVDTLRLPAQINVRAAIKIKVEHAHQGKAINTIENLDHLTFHIAGNMDAAGAVYEELFEHCTHVMLRPIDPDSMRIQQGTVLEPGIDALEIQACGLGTDESLLPEDARVFDGYRILREYSCLPQKFMFFRLKGPELTKFAASCEQAAFEVIFLFDRGREEIERLVDGKRFRLFCVPAVNLFDRRADQILLRERFDRAHVVVDKTRPLAYEVYHILTVQGTGERLGGKVTYQPFYRNSKESRSNRYYTVHRETRKLSHREVRFGMNHDYPGSEVHLRLVNAGHGVETEINALSIRVLCTNRHLPLAIPIGVHDTDFFVDSGIPTTGIKAIIAPTSPVQAPTGGILVWKLVSQLSLNYISIVNDEHGAKALKSILDLYAETSNGDTNHWTKSLISANSKSVVRRHPEPGPIAYIRGIEVTILLDEARLAGHSAYSLGMILSKFLAQYVSINSYVETVIQGNRRGILGRWIGTQGNKQTL